MSKEVAKQVSSQERVVPGSSSATNKGNKDEVFTTGSQKHSVQNIENRKKVNNNDILVASAVHSSNKLPIPNSEGTIGSVPLEKVHPRDMKTAPSRGPNRKDTSISGPGIFDKMSTKDKEDLSNLILNDNEETLFPWRSVGKFHSSGKGVPNTVDSNAIKAYMIENFYNDWYSNVATVLGTCFFSWLLAYCGFSWWSLGFIFLGTSSVYNTEYRRFNRNVRDDLLRITVEETLSDKVESTLWLNSFLSKFWVIYMPVLSQQVKDIANPQLVDAAPGYGIDSLSLDEFTLGSKAPAIRGIKTYTKSGKNIVEMDWSFAFTPNDVSDMTPTEAKEKINPKIALGVSIGKGVISKSLPILVEDINCAGRIHIKLEFGKIFPNIKLVSVQFLEAPLIDFALKPIGGDTLGLDVMSFLPGLKSFVKTMVNSNVGPMLYAPNHLDIDVEEIMAAQANDAIGVLAVTVTSATNLKSSDFITNTVDPYIVLKTEKSLPGDDTEVRTAIKSDVKNPTWDETKYILVNSLNQKLSLTCYDFNDVRKDTLIGSIDIDMNDLYQTPSVEKTSSDLLIGSKSRGSLNYSLNWYPVIHAPKKESNDASDEEQVDNDDSDDDLASIDSGIAKLTLQKITDISSAASVTGNLSPSAEFYIDGKLVKSFRTLKRINEPSWNETFEVLIPSKSNSKLSIKVYDNRGSNKVLLCEYLSNLEDGLNTLEAGSDSVQARPFGKIFIDAQWKPVELSDSVVTKKLSNEPLGTVRINVGKISIKGDLNGVGDVDPYFTVSLNRHIRYKSNHFSDCTEATFDQLVYVPVSTEQQFITASLFDYQSVGTDRFIGSANFSVSDLIERSQETNGYSTKTNILGRKMTLKLKDSKNITTQNTMELEFSFIPSEKVYSPMELESVEKLQADLRERKEKFEETQIENKKAMDENPDNWEVATVANPFEEDEKIIHKKKKLTFDELISTNSGVLVLQIVSGKLSRASTYLNIHVDDTVFPDFTSAKFRGSKMIAEVGYIFIRDLKHSKLLFRVSKKHVAKDNDDVVSELYVDTMKVLKDSYKAPTQLKFSGSSITVQTLFNPSTITLPAFETVRDTGILALKVISGTGLLSADRNGFSDPFVHIYVDGKMVFRTKTIKKTLDPVWNENVNIQIPSMCKSHIVFNVLDWDRAGDNDELGATTLDLKTIVPNQSYTWDCKLSTQGSIKLQGTFKPQYTKPTMDVIHRSISNVPFKAIGTVGGAGINAASTVAGAAVGIAGVGAGGIKKGGSLLKSFGGGKFGGQRSSSDRLQRPSSNGRTSLDYYNNTPNTSYANVQSHTPTTPRMSDVNNDAPHGTSPSENEVFSNGGTPTANTTNRRSRASSFARTLAPNGTYDGTINIISAENVAKNVQIKVSATQGGRMKSLYKTKNQKSDEEGLALINETCKFKASPEANIVLTAISRHIIGKDKDAGVAQILLSDPKVQAGDNLSVKIGSGQVIIQINYGQSNSDIPPPLPEVPQESF